MSYQHSKTGQRRTRTLLVLGFGSMTLVLGLMGYQASRIVKTHEARVIAGDFPFIHVEAEPVVVEENGQVKSASGPKERPRYVASLRLIPPGRYQVLLIAHDGNPKRRKKSELVIGAQNTNGVWYPGSAVEIHKRLQVAEAHDK
jgi:hypothetical protein